MFFVKINYDAPTLDDIRHVAEHMLNPKIAQYLTDTQKHELETIIRPTLARDHNEPQIRAFFDDIITNFVAVDEHNKVYRFYVDKKAGLLYFGDEAGLQEAKSLETSYEQHQSQKP